MVTKRTTAVSLTLLCSVLAKINMVTKLNVVVVCVLASSVLAKINMVTKPQKYGSTFLNVIEY